VWSVHVIQDLLFRDGSKDSYLVGGSHVINKKEEDLNYSSRILITFRGGVEMIQ
jgi:hypothetical protein